MNPSGEGTPVLCLDRFGFPDGKARLVSVDWTKPMFEPTKEFDLHLNNGRLLEHFHEGNMTYKSSGITHKVPSEWLEVSPALAKERKLKDGALVRLTSPYGEVEVRVIVTDRVKGKELYLTMNTSKENRSVNRLTSSYHDDVTHTPNYKEMSVNMEILESEGVPPLPPVNYRFGNRQPQISVRVEEKWKRDDWISIPKLLQKGEGNDGQSNHQH